MWNIILFESTRGEKPIKDFIKSLSYEIGPKVVRGIDLLEKFGNLLGMPHSKRIGPNIYELRIRGKEEIRIFYTFKKNNIYLLHAFQKKTQKIPRKEFETAIKRLDLI